MSDLKKDVLNIEKNIRKLQDEVRNRTGIKDGLDKAIEASKKVYEVEQAKLKNLKDTIAKEVAEVVEPKLKEVADLKVQVIEETARATQGRIDAEGRKKEYEDKLKEVERVSKKAIENRDALEALRQEAVVTKVRLQKILDTVKAIINE